MKLRTKIPVTHLDVDKIPSAGTKKSIVTMNISDRILTIGDNIARIETSYSYTDVDGNVLPTKMNGAFRKDSPGELKAMSQAVHLSIPEDNNIVDRINNEVIAFCTVELSTLFGITAAEVEVVQ